MAVPTAENLLFAMRSVLHQITLTPEALQGIIMKYSDENSFPSEQSTKTLNSLLRELGVETGKVQRAELVICQIILLTWFKVPFFRDTEDLCLSYGFEKKDVIADKSLAEFVWYMESALMLVRGKKHMDFLITEVVVPLSEKLSNKRYPPGGGHETIGTAMRFRVFETETGCFRPKSLKQPPPGPSSHFLDELAVLSDLPAPAMQPLLKPLADSKKRKRTSAAEATPSESGTSCYGADSFSEVSGNLGFFEELPLNLADFDNSNAL